MSAPLARRLAAFAALYLIWGSTFLAIRTGVETIPPFLMAGTRSVLAGLILCGWAWSRGAARPTAAQWKAAVLAGALYFLIGHGGLFWAEQRVTSGAAALVQATVPLWMVAAEWLRPGGSAPDRRVAAGIGVGLAGVALLPMGGGPGGVDPLGLAVLLVSAMAWVAASAFFRGERRPASQAYAAGMPLLTGGALLFAASLATGETARVEAADVTPAAVAALAYLVVFGSVIAFTAYTWLVQVETPVRAGSYAYVNPLVALTLGWAFAGEALTPRMLLAAGIIVGSVFLVVTGRGTPRRPSRKPLRPRPMRPTWRAPRGASPVHRYARGGKG